MTRSFTDLFTAAGAVAAPWQMLTGAASKASGRLDFTTAPGSNPIAAVLMGRRGNGQCDLEVAAVPNHVYGNAIYPRIKDATNWVRAVVRSTQTSTPYYVTEYQHSVYQTETLWQPQRWKDSYQPKRQQIEVEYNDGCSTGAWSGYSDTGAPTGCRATAPNAPADETGACGLSTKEYRYVTNNFNCGTAGNNQYQLQQRTRTVTQIRSTKWVEAGYTVQQGETLTGGTRLVDNGAVYNVQSSSSSATNPGKTTTGNTVYDQYIQTFLAFSGDPQYWAVSRSFPLDGSTGSTRQVVASTYWDTTFESGVPTRQTGPFTDTVTNYLVELEQSVAGVVTSLGVYNHGGSSLTGFKVRADGDTLQVFLNNVLRLTGTSSAHKTTGVLAGIGGGASVYNPLNPSFLDFTAEGIVKEFVRTAAGTWVPGDRKVRVGTAWVDTDAVRQ